MVNKYVIVKGHPVLFSSELIHAEVVNNTGDLEGAGFFVIMRDAQTQKTKVICLGESTSLAVSSRPEIDQKIIGDFLKLEKGTAAQAPLMSSPEYKSSDCNTDTTKKKHWVVILKYISRFLFLKARK